MGGVLMIGLGLVGEWVFGGGVEWDVGGVGGFKLGGGMVLIGEVGGLRVGVEELKGWGGGS